MEKKYKYLLGHLNNISSRFDEALSREKNNIIRDAAIFRFKIVYELAWKTMRACLDEKGLKELYSPKEAIKNAYQNRIVDNDPLWLEMVDTRNETSHMCKEAMAENVYNKLPRYLPPLKKLVKELS